MPVELGSIRLDRIHRIATLEQADFVNHRIPGLEGNVVQDVGRDSVRLQIEGIFYSQTAQADMEGLREIYKAREPVDFLAEIVGQAYFAQVILERFEVVQRAHEPDQFSFLLVVAEYVVPPEPELPAAPDIDLAILEEAQNFMDIAELPDTLSLPEFRDPTAPLGGLLEGVQSSLSALDQTSADLSELFGEE